MNLTLTLHNWKYYTNETAVISDGNLIIYGNNGSGKTSLLSAIYSIYMGQPWPGKRFADFLRLGSDYFGLSTENQGWYLAGKKGMNGRISTKFENGGDEKPQIFVYEPEFNGWLSGTRTAKLRSLDTILTQGYGKTYSQPLLELNMALKGKQNLISYLEENPGTQSDPIILEQLNQSILQNSHKLWELRNKFLQDFVQNGVSRLQSQIVSDLSGFQLRYEIANIQGKRTGTMDWLKDVDANMMQRLWQRERAAGRVLFGAQRDDFCFEINSANVINYLSRGETRIMTLQLIIEAAKLHRGTQNKQVWLLADDIFNELDEQRERSICDNLETGFDRFIATAAKSIEAISYNQNIKSIVGATVHYNK